MLPSRRPFLADEELGKKDDDHRPRTNTDRLWQPKQWKPPRRRRILLGIVILYLLYIFFKNMPTDLPPARQRLGLHKPSTLEQGNGPQTTYSSILQSGPPPRDKSPSEADDELYYEGPMQFFFLGKTLRAWKTRERDSTAAVFAAANLRSASDLLPLACRMAAQKLNEVHFVIMGREDVLIDDIARVNGVDNADCSIHWHDARVDYSRWSTDFRMEQAVAIIISYLKSHLSPRVVITQGESWEEPFFSRGIRKTQEFGITHLALPCAARDLMWISSLNTNALRVWNDIDVEFLIYAPPDSTGSLIRLIRSLENADFLGSTPSITVELPSNVDSALLNFLKTMKTASFVSNKLTIRRRILPSNRGPIEAALKEVEAFYPRDPDFSHVLVLSPDIELAPSFYHYLVYTILKYKYSSRAGISSPQLVGISLELPSLRLTSQEPFKPPDIDSSQFSARNGPDTVPLFLWQAPISNAALYFGDKWVEFHTFLSRRLTAQDTSDIPLNEKVISTRYPAMMEYLLELVRARGYYMLYPAFSKRGIFSLATFHSEIIHYPEEFAGEMENAPISDQEPNSLEEPLSRAPTIMTLLDQFSLALPEIGHLPKFSYLGDEISDLVFLRDTQGYLRRFRARYGGCPDEPFDESPDSLAAKELFCIND